MTKLGGSAPHPPASAPNPPGVHPTAIVAPNVHLGEESVVGEYVVLGRAPRGKREGELPLFIGPGAVIRPFTTIYAGARIGARLQTGQGASIREDNQLGDDVSVGTHASLEFGNRVGSRVRIQLLARDIILATQSPHALSVRNALQGTVAQISADTDQAVLIEVDIGGAIVLARITQNAVEALGLRLGSAVWVLVKAVSTRGHAFRIS